MVPSRSATPEMDRGRRASGARALMLHMTFKGIMLLLAGPALILAGCGQQADPMGQGWTAAIRITDTKDSLVGGVVLHKWHNAVFALQPQDNMEAKCFLL